MSLSRALEKIDELTEHIANPEQALEIVKVNRGHLIDAYKRFLRFMTDSRSGVNYEWISPDRGQPLFRGISSSEAERLYEMLIIQQDLTVEDVVLRGVFFRANVDSGAWALRDDSGTARHGRIASGSNVTLSGVVLDTQRYELECIERVEESGGGELSTTLEVKSLRKL